jgi:hypothetical protein
MRAVPVFAVTVKATFPFPVPDAPLVIAIQLAFDVAVHVQLASVPTAIVPPPPESGMFAVVGATP